MSGTPGDAARGGAAAAVVVGAAADQRCGSLRSASDEMPTENWPLSTFRLALRAKTILRGGLTARLSVLTARAISCVARLPSRCAAHPQMPRVLGPTCSSRIRPTHATARAGQDRRWMCSDLEQPSLALPALRSWLGASTRYRYESLSDASYGRWRQLRGRHVGRGSSSVGCSDASGGQAGPAVTPSKGG